MTIRFPSLIQEASMLTFRVVLPACLAIALGCGSPKPPPASAGLGAEMLLSGLDRPVRLVSPPGDDRLFVVEQVGRIRVYDRDGGDRGVFLDLTGQTVAGGERGLLGLAFSPDYADDGRFYVNYTNRDGDTRIMRYRVSTADPDRADPGSAVLVLAVDQPYGNHNGGMIAFGPDGLLYVGMGDGGGSGDTGNRAQDGGTLLGKLLRLDVSPPAGYVIPADNPFVGGAPRDEIWALGLRNPWVFDFDTATGDLWIADVGQDAWEEIDFAPAGEPGGRNYGWRLMEGTACFDPPSGCETAALVLPVHVYAHGGDPFRCSISGGCVYRGTAVPSLAGRYLFADFCSNQIWALTPRAGGGAAPAVEELTAELQPPGGYAGIAGICRDGAGELYVLDVAGGRVVRIIAD
jgi:glucose/arabinose dehydrogenase